MKIKVNIYAIIFFQCLVLGFANAGENLSLDKALMAAYDNNPRMIEARKLVNVAKGDLITARTLPNPEVDFEIGGLKENEKGKRKGELNNIAVRQDLGFPGSRLFDGKISKNQVLSQEESFKTVWSDIYLEVRQIYAKIMLDKKGIELAQGNLDILRSFFSRVQLRFQSGQALKNDVQRAMIELLKAENSCFIAEKELKIDKAKLNLLLGRSFDVSFDIESELKEESVELNFKELSEKALLLRPDLKTEKLQLDSANKKLIKEQLNRLPAPFIGFQRTTEDYENDSAVVVGLSVPLWNLNQGEVKKAKAQKEAQQVRVDAVKREVVFEVYEAYAEAELAEKQLNLAKKSIEEANELLRLANLRYSEGAVDFINYLDQVKAVTESRVGYYEFLFKLNDAVSNMEKTIYESLRGEGYLK
ncbi:MAG: TolC family protein [Candidatus Omnitrophota bacterium]|nr:TolC family protein [Candidatus Omnitrophota bacterium]